MPCSKLKWNWLDLTTFTDYLILLYWIIQKLQLSLVVFLWEILLCKGHSSEKLYWRQLTEKIVWVISKRVNGKEDIFELKFYRFWLPKSDVIFPVPFGGTYFRQSSVLICRFFLLVRDASCPDRSWYCSQCMFERFCIFLSHRVV